MSEPTTIPEWPRGPHHWTEGRTLYVSVPFTWNLPEVRSFLLQRSLLWDTAVVGGPAVKLMPGYLAGLERVTLGDELPGVLQRVNPMATRTTIGCPRRCAFCGVGTIEPGPFRELVDWPDLPILCDNNIIAASLSHFERVIERLTRWGWADFNQGLDARLLTKRHASLIAGIGKPMVRLALDWDGMRDEWERAFGVLREAGMPLHSIRSYAIIGHGESPAQSWDRCEWIESHGVKVLPMWFHRLDAWQLNVVTQEQMETGWNDFERRRIMQWFYQHKKAVA